MANQEFRAIVRIADSDVKGDMTIAMAMTRAHGCGHMMSNAVCKVIGIDIRRKAGTFSQKEIDAIGVALKNPKKYNIPEWLFNRRKDVETGEDEHLMSHDLKLRKEFDIRGMKKIKSYVGMRHAKRLKVRGQRTRSTGRKGTTLGVKRKKK